VKADPGEKAIVSNIKELRTSMDSSFEVVKEDLLKTEKGLKVSVGIQAFLLIFVIFYLGWLYSQVSKIDAESVVQTTKVKFLNSLPSIGNEVSEQIKASAPQTIESLRKSSLDVIPQVRKDMQRHLLTETIKLTTGIGDEVNHLISEYVKSHAEDIKKKNPSLSDLDKARRLMKMIRMDFKETVKQATDKHLDEYAKDMRKLNKEMKKLRTSKKLTKKEMYQKKMVSVWVKLMKLEVKEMPHVKETPVP